MTDRFPQFYVDVNVQVSTARTGVIAAVVGINAQKCPLFPSGECGHSYVATSVSSTSVPFDTSPILIGDGDNLYKLSSVTLSLGTPVSSGGPGSPTTVTYQSYTLMPQAHSVPVVIGTINGLTLSSTFSFHYESGSIVPTFGFVIQSN